MNEILLEGLDKAAVLAALYNASRPLGMGFLHYDPKPMTIEEAREILEQRTCFDYLKGRVMKIDLSGDTLSTRLYNRDNGPGAAEMVFAQLRDTGNTSVDNIEAVHFQGLEDGIRKAREFTRTPTTFERLGGFEIIKLGGEDIADELGAALDRAEEA